MTWQTFRHQYESAVVATWPKLDKAIWRNVADDLERLADPATLADAAGYLAAFEATLIGVAQRSPRQRTPRP
jgi:hypothetical protein